ncbi:hypothetical protein IKA92_00370 [bacterium]|nr:hypothetical protein [bacterium]
MRINSINNISYKSLSTANLVLEAGGEKKSDKKNAIKVGVASAVGSLVGLSIPFLLIRKKQGLNIPKGALKELNFSEKIGKIWKSLNIDYNLLEILSISTGSLLGGLLGGVLVDKNKDHRKEKVEEALHTFNNILIPTTLTNILLKTTKKAKIKSPIDKIISPIIGIGVGMVLANKVTNKITKKFIDPDMPERKQQLKDYFVHIDDILGVLVLTKIPFADKIQAGKLLTAVYAYCGFKAGIGHKHD